MAPSWSISKMNKTKVITYKRKNFFPWNLNTTFKNATAALFQLKSFRYGLTLGENFTLKIKEITFIYNVTIIFYFFLSILCFSSSPNIDQFFKKNNFCSIIPSYRASLNYWKSAIYLHSMEPRLYLLVKNTDKHYRSSLLEAKRYLMNQFTAIHRWRYCLVSA